MRKVILEIGSPNVAEISNPNFKMLRDICTEYQTLQPVRLPDGNEVLEKKPNKEGGFTYVYPDFSYRKFKQDGKPVDDNPTGRIKLCQAATGKISPAFGKDMLSAVAELKQQNRGYVELTSEIIGKVVSGEYKPIDLNTLNKEVFPRPNTWFLYNKTGIQQSLANIAKVVEDGIKKYGWTFTAPDDVDLRQQASFLGVEVPQLLEDSDVKAWAAIQYPKTPLGNVKIYPLNADTKKTNNTSKDKCKLEIKKLSDLSVCNQKPAGRGNCTGKIKQMGGELVTLKKTVAGCLSDGKMFRQFLGIGLKSEINRIGNPDSPDYDAQLGVGRELENLRQNAAADGVTLPVNESYDTRLKKLVREHLMRLSNSKKKSTITSKKVVREHFLKIVNSKMNKTDKINRIVTEGYFMINSGVNEKLINEEFSWLSNLLGIGGKGIITTFKTNIVKKLIDKFIPGGSDSWLGGIVANSIGSIPLGDYFNGNILKCDFVSDAITRGITSEVLTKVQENKDLTGGFYDVIKNSMAEYIDDTPFFNAVQKGISNMICPYMEDISGSLGKAFSSVGGDIKKEFTGSK